MTAIPKEKRSLLVGRGQPQTRRPTRLIQAGASPQHECSGSRIGDQSLSCQHGYIQLRPALIVKLERRSCEKTMTSQHVCPNHRDIRALPHLRGADLDQVHNSVIAGHGREGKPGIVVCALIKINCKNENCLSRIIRTRAIVPSPLRHDGCRGPGRICWEGWRPPY
jgi:hypothetical protein